MPDAAQIEAEARTVGWRPPADLEAEGKTGTFLSAEEYLSRGRAIMPFLKKDNEKLTRQVLSQQTAIAATQAQLKEATDAIKGLEEYHAEMLTSNAKRIREETKRELAAAAKDGDFDEVARLTEVLAKPLEAPKKEVKVETPPPADPSKDPAFVSWLGLNPWMHTDQTKGRMAMGIALDLRGKFPGLVGAPFYAMLDEELAKTAPPRPRSKVDGDGGAPPANRSEGKSYSDLPKEAKDACASFEKRFASQIGKDKRYPDVNAWRAKYAADFFKE